MSARSARREHGHEGRASHYCPCPHAATFPERILNKHGTVYPRAWFQGSITYRAWDEFVLGEALIAGHVLRNLELSALGVCRGRVRAALEGIDVGQAREAAYMCGWVRVWDEQ